MKLKHSLLALGAAAALGVAGSAHAATFFGYYADTSASNKATGLEVRDGGSGDMLVVPYFNAQGKTQTALHITNQDSVGKVVRVHVRGAANGDILKSFTVLLGAHDTWTFTIDPVAGAAPQLNSAHPACVFTDTNGATGKLGEPLSLDNLAPYISAAAKIQHAGEGYIEIINMAEVVSGSTMDAINKRNCGALNALVRDFEPSKEADVKATGLVPTFGGLSGIWYLINQDTWTAYSGRMTAIRASDGAGKGRLAQIRFFPQRTTAEVLEGGTDGEKLTLAFMSLGSAERPFTATMDTGGWSALPDLSMPISDAFAMPQEQITAIGKAVNLKKDIVNDFASLPTGAVPMFTDWIMSNPLQRYYAGVDYGKSAAEAKVVKSDYGSGVTLYGADGSTMENTDIGPVVCQKAELSIRDRAGTVKQEKNLEPCGAVWTLGFASQSPVAASVGRIVLTPPAAAGWANLEYDGDPVALGFAAFSAKNKDTGISYPTTWPHARY